jgi:hypothetical protein
MPPDESQESASSSSAAEAAVANVPAPNGGGIKTAAEVIEKVLAADKPEAKPAAEAKPSSKPAKDSKEPGRRVEKLEAKAVEKAAETEATPEPEADASVIAKARYHLQHGDVAKFIDTVVGDFKAEGLPDAVREALGRKLGVGSAQWEKIRRYEQGAKRAVAAREAELSTVVQRLQAEYRPFHEARSLYQAGDYDAAFKAAFGEDAADYQRKVIGQRVGKNPEIEKLRAELEAERAERHAAAEREQAARSEAEERAAVEAYVADLGQQLAASEDPAVRKYSARPAFVQRVLAIQRAHYDAASNTTLPARAAAEMARDEILDSLNQWRIDDDTGGTPAKAAQASALPAKPPVAKAPARTLKQSQAAEGSGKPVKETSAQVRERYQRLMETLAD